MVSTQSRSKRSTTSTQTTQQERKPSQKRNSSQKQGNSDSQSTQHGAALTATEQRKIRAALMKRRDALQEEYDHARAELYDLQSGQSAEATGEDSADSGVQTLEREQEFSIAHGMLERMRQVEHALKRLDTGNYGTCERCGKQISPARLEAFPAATLCINCKQLEERR